MKWNIFSNVNTKIRLKCISKDTKDLIDELTEYNVFKAKILKGIETK